MHPTGMHSCYSCCLPNLKYPWRILTPRFPASKYIYLNLWLKVYFWNIGLTGLQFDTAIVSTQLPTHWGASSFTTEWDFRIPCGIQLDTTVNESLQKTNILGKKVISTEIHMKSPIWAHYWDQLLNIYSCFFTSSILQQNSRVSVLSRQLGFSYFEFKIRLTLSFHKQKFLYFNSKPTDS